MAYITYSDVQTFLEATLTAAEQAVVNLIIPGLEAFIESETGCKWNQNGSITEKFDGGANVFFLSKPKAGSITSVKIDGVAVESGDIYNYGDYIKVDALVNPGYQNVEIVYTQESNNLPSDVKLALIRWSAEIFKAHKEAGKTINRTSSGPISVDFATKDVPDYIERIISRYSLPAL